MRIHPRLAVFALAFSLVSCAQVAHDAANSAATTKARVEAALARMLATDGLANARIGVEVKDLATGERIVAHDADKGFMTASNMKLVSTAVALSTLSPSFRWRTRVVASSSTIAADGTLAGDVFLVGGGDPSLGGPPRAEGSAGDGLDALAEQLHRRGVRRITGSVRGDASGEPFPIYGSGWQWDYLEEDYAAPSCGLDYALNVAEVRVHATADGNAATMSCSPDIALPWLTLRVATVAKDAPTKIRFHRVPHSDRVVVEGSIAAGGKPYRVPAAVGDPAQFAAAAFASALRRRGIVVEGGEPTSMRAPEGCVELASHASAPLSEVAVPLLANSINLYAEQAWRAAAFHGKGLGTFADCERHAIATLRSMGVPADGMVLADGSGLSRRNLVQPRQFVALLAHAHGDAAMESLRKGLPVAGESGTLRSRYPRGAAKWHVRAKTGFISHVVALSGYVDKKDGSAPFAFSVLLNHFTCESDRAKAAVDAFVEELAACAGWPAD